MKIFRIIFAAAILSAMTSCSSSTPEERASRRFNDEGNRMMADDRYADAEAAYTKAVNANPQNLEAKYNLALSIIRQTGPGESGKKLLEKARGLLAEVAESSSATDELASAAAYNIGNMAYNTEQWDPAIEDYKSSLRHDPDNDNARDNLRLAQLKKQENQNNQQDNKQDKDNKDKNKDQQQNQQKDQQQDQQNQKNQNQDSEKKDEKPQQTQPQTGMSDENAEKILKAMENEEAATRRRVLEAEKRKAGQAGRRIVTNPW